MKDLDDKISAALFGGLSSSQLMEVNEILDKSGDSWEAIRDFFEKQNIDFRNVIKETMNQFAKETMEDD